ncbi:hypothetical protein ACS0TY_003463 [Phlomoides rotata]
MWSDESEHLLVEDKCSARIFTLNKPKQLNVVTAAMIARLLDLYLASAQDPCVKLIILKGRGRAFCVGGDIVTVARHAKQGNWKANIIDFRTALTMMYVIATQTKPQVAILNGIVMGGGACASIHGRFRIATENSIFAMPETALGFFPDMGSSHFLSRLPGFFGEYVGLTGAWLDGAEMFACGLATHFVPSERLEELEEAIVKADSSVPAVISSVIEKFSEMPTLKEDSAYRRLDIVNKCFCGATVEEIVAALEKEAAENDDDWISTAIYSLNKASPMSLKNTLRSIREGRVQGIEKCVVREFRMVCHVLKGDISKDFVEVPLIDLTCRVDGSSTCQSCKFQCTS